MSALFVSVEDLRGESVDAVAARAAGWGCTELAVSFAYHAARDVTPHGNTRVTVRRDGLSFVPGPEAFAGSRLQPAVLVDDPNFAGEIVAGAAAHGLTVTPWVVFLHNEELGLRHPEVTQVNCFGDRAAPADLCPANPKVRSYCVELALAALDAVRVDDGGSADHSIGELLAESLHFGAFGHGYHHERDFVGLGPLEQLLLGLCFCGHCMRLATRAGVDAAAARGSAAQLIERLFAGIESRLSDGEALTPHHLGALGGSELRDYALARSATVSSLVAEVAEVLGERGTRLTFLDLTGASQGYADGLPGEPSGLDEGWQLGIDVAEISAHAGVGILAYARDAARISTEAARYREVIRDQRLRVVLRPGAPDCFNAENLTEKVSGVRRTGASCDFYHYGLLPFSVLDRIGEVHARVSA